MRLVFMGTPGFALPTLKALFEAGHDIAAIYTQPPRPAGRGQKDTPSPVYQFALEKNIPVFTPVSLKSPVVQDEFAAHKAEVAVVVAYGLLLPKAILEAYPLGCINVHPSLLPRWRGAAPIQRTIMAGDKETAIVIMKMDEGLDTGDMLLVEHYPIAPGTTAGQLHDTLAEKAGPLVLKTLANHRSIVPQKQSADGITYAHKITKEETFINWSQPAEAIYQQILGLSPSPGMAFFYHDEYVKIFDATYESRAVDAKPGTVVDDRIGIACNPGILHPIMLQRQGKKRLHIDEFLRGSHIPAGTNVLP